MVAFRLFDDAAEVVDRVAEVEKEPVESGVDRDFAGGRRGTDAATCPAIPMMVDDFISYKLL